MDGGTGTRLQLAPAPTTISEQDSRVRLLLAWDQLNSTYPPLSLQQVDAVLAELEHALAPADPRVVAAAIATTMGLWRAPNQAQTADFYVEALEEFPPAVVAAACKHVRLTHRFPNAPLPADFRAAALKAAEPLRGAQVRARLARRRLQDVQDREQRWHDREPVVIGAGTYDTRTKVKAVPREAGDATGETHLGDVSANLERWAQETA